MYAFASGVTTAMLSGIGVAIGIMVCMTVFALFHRAAMGGKQDQMKNGIWVVICGREHIACHGGVVVFWANNLETGTAIQSFAGQFPTCLRGIERRIWCFFLKHVPKIRTLPLDIFLGFGWDFLASPSL